MNLDTAVVQRLRDALVQQGHVADSAAPAASIGGDVEHRDETLERFTPFAETMFLVAIADGVEDPAEMAALRGAMHILTANQIPEQALIDIYQRCKHDVSEYGVDAYLERIGLRISTDRMDRETAFTLAAAVALADDEVHGSETELMGSIAMYFGISDSAARRLLEDV